MAYNKRRTETLDYMQSMLGQMRTMAEAERCDMLAYLVEMAYVEVSDIIRGERPARVHDRVRDPARNSSLFFGRAGTNSNR
ncbi:MAG: hypothetical protein L0I29_19525 [Hyphomicrobiales bacterium]|nr:hypothetical protein [Hyphomicrobiales bacterium]